MIVKGGIARMQFSSSNNRVVLKRQFAAFYSLVVCEFYRQQRRLEVRRQGKIAEVKNDVARLKQWPARGGSAGAGGNS